MVRGATRRGLLGLLGQLTGRAESDHHVGGHQARDDPGPDVAGLGARGAGVEDHPGPALGVREEQSDHRDDADDLAGDADVVDPRHPVHADAVDDGGRPRAGSSRAAPRWPRRWARSARCRRRRTGSRSRSFGRTTCSAIAAAEAVTIWAMIMNQPANQPTISPAHPPRPLVDGAGDRVARGELGEAQRHQNWPTNTIGQVQKKAGPPKREAEAEELEDRGEDRDEGEARRERGEPAERAVQLLFVAEFGQVRRRPSCRRSVFVIGVVDVSGGALTMVPLSSVTRLPVTRKVSRLTLRCGDGNVSTRWPDVTSAFRGFLSDDRNLSPTVG